MWTSLFLWYCTYYDELEVSAWNISLNPQILCSNEFTLLHSSTLQYNIQSKGFTIFPAPRIEVRKTWKIPNCVTTQLCYSNIMVAYKWHKLGRVLHLLWFHIEARLIWVQCIYILTFLSFALSAASTGVHTKSPNSTLIATVGQGLI